MHMLSLPEDVVPGLAPEPAYAQPFTFMEYLRSLLSQHESGLISEAHARFRYNVATCFITSLFMGDSISAASILRKALTSSMDSMLHSMLSVATSLMSMTEARTYLPVASASASLSQWGLTVSVVKPDRPSPAISAMVMHGYTARHKTAKKNKMGTEARVVPAMHLKMHDLLLFTFRKISFMSRPVNLVKVNYKKPQVLHF